MSVLDDAISFLKGVQGIVDVYLMDDVISKNVEEMENSIRTRTNHDYRNVGYEFAMKRQYRICVFYTSGYLFEKRSLVKLMTTDGTIMGTTLYPEEIPEYQKKENIIWISEDFVLFPDIIGHGEEEFVLYPFDATELMDAVPGCINAIGTSPTTSSDTLLKEKVGISPDEPDLFTSVIAFDIR